MSTFADSSALVKRYADEQGHAQVRELTAVVVSQIARVEVPAALWAKQRREELAADDARVLTAEFEADYFGSEEHETPPLAAIALSAPILDAAARLSATHGLRASDAVQLSSALAARAADAGCTTFAAFEGTLRTAAAAEGFMLLPADG